MTKKKKRTLTVDADDVEEEILREFTRHASGYLVPRGEFLSRALYLLLLEADGEISTQRDLAILKERAERDGRRFKEELFQDTKAWKQYLWETEEKLHREKVEKSRQSRREEHKPK